MEQIQVIMLEKALRILNAIDLDYVIQVNDGSEPYKKGKLEVVVKKVSKRNQTVPRGTYKDYLIKNGFDDMVVGTPFVLNPLLLDPIALRGAAVSRGCQLWGNGSINSTIKNGLIEFLRT